MSTTSLGELATVTHKATGCIPPKLLGASTTVVGDTVYLLGGTKGRESSEQLFHMYIFNLNTNVWSKIPQPEGAAPSPRYLHSTDLWNGYLVVFGGIVIEKRGESPYVLDDIWFFSILESCWIVSTDSPTSSRPLPRYGHLSSISAGQLFIIGGQDKSDQWINDMHLYDLKSRKWVHSSSISYECGTYRGLAAFSNFRVVDPLEEGYGNPIRFKSDTPTAIPPTPSDKFVELPYSAPVTEENPSEIYMYLNYDFTNPRRELRQYKATNDQQNPFTYQDLTSDMQAKFLVPSSVPPTLRFPTGGIIGSYLVLSGIDFTTRHTMGTWALNLRTSTWAKIEMSSSLAKGSWARSVVWPSSDRLVIFGSRDADFEDDYQSRLLSWDDVVCIDLEAFGIYKPPLQAMNNMAKSIGLAALEDEVFADFLVVCDDGRSISCSRELLERRWPWFLEERKRWDARASATYETSGEGIVIPALSFSRTSVVLLRPDPRLTPRKLYLFEPYPVVVAFLQYLYTQSLLTPLQLAPAVLSSLMLLAATYDIPRLMDLVAHAMHDALSRSRKFAPGIYDVVSLIDRSGLRHRALWIGRRPNKSDRGHCHPRKPDHHQPNEPQPCPLNLPSADANSDLEPNHKDASQHKQQTQRPSRQHGTHSRSASPQSVPVSVSPSPTELTPTASFTPNAPEDRTPTVQNDKIRSSIAIRRATAVSMSASFVAAVLEFSDENDAIMGLTRRDLMESGKPNESETMAMQSDDPTGQHQLHHLNTHNPHANTTSIPGTSDRPRPARLSTSHTDTEFQVSELKLLELKSVINQTLGSVALGPTWDTRTSVEMNRRLSRNGLDTRTSVEMNRRLSRNGLTFDPHRIKATSGHRLLIDPRSTMTSPLTRMADTGLMTFSLTAINEEYGENKGEGKGKERETRAPRFSYKTGHGYPASALNPTSAGLNSLSVPIKSRERSTTVPQPYVHGSHSTAPYRMSRQLGPLPATPSPSTTNPNGTTTPSTPGLNIKSGTNRNTNTCRMANVRTSSLPRTQQDTITRTVPRTVSLGQQSSNYVSHHHQHRSNSRDSPSSSAPSVAPNGSSGTSARHPLPPTPPHSDESARSSLSNSPSHSNSKRNRLSTIDHKGLATSGSPVTGLLMTMSPTSVTLKSTTPVDSPKTRSKMFPRPLPPTPDAAQTLSLA